MSGSINLITFYLISNLSTPVNFEYVNFITIVIYILWKFLNNLIKVDTSNF